MADGVAEKRTTWSFEIEEGGSVWRWARVEPTGKTSQSRRAFASLHECAKDATEHGYGEWKDEERRQVESRYDALLGADWAPAVREIRSAAKSTTG